PRPLETECSQVDRVEHLESMDGHFIATTVATSLTGFGFPFVQLLPSPLVGVISLIVLSQTTQRTLNITSASTNPSRGGANACGRRPARSKPPPPQVPHPPSLRARSGDGAAVVPVTPPAGLVLAKEIRAHGASVNVRDERFVAGREPEGERVVAAQVSRKRICLAETDRRLENRPDRLAVGGGGGAYHDRAFDF